MFTPATPPDNPQWIPDQYDDIRWGASLRGDVPASSPEDLADRAGLPRPVETADGVEHLHIAHEQTRRWSPPREASEYDPTKSGVPSPGFRATMAPVSNPKGSVTRQPRAKRPVVNWIP